MGSCALEGLLAEFAHARDPEFIREASKRGVFAHISDDDVEDWQSSIDIVLRRFAEYHDLQGAFGRRALIERATGIRHRPPAPHISRRCDPHPARAALVVALPLEFRRRDARRAAVPRSLTNQLSDGCSPSIDDARHVKQPLEDRRGRRDDEPRPDLERLGPDSEQHGHAAAVHERDVPEIVLDQRRWRPTVENEVERRGAYVPGVPTVAARVASVFPGIWVIARSASAVIVRLGLAPTFAGIAAPSQTSRFS